MSNFTKDFRGATFMHLFPGHSSRSCMVILSSMGYLGCASIVLMIDINVTVSTHVMILTFLLMETSKVARTNRFVNVTEPRELYYLDGKF